MKFRSLYIYIASLAVVALFNACRHDIDLEMDDTAGVLCVNAILTADTAENLIYVSKTVESSSQSGYYINYGKMNVNSTVSVYVNGTLTETVDNKSMIDNVSSMVHRIKTVFHEDDFVHIDVTTEDGQKASFEGVVPKHVANLNIDNVALALGKTYKNDRGHTETDNMFNVSLSFDDDGGDNFYTLAIGERDSTVSPVNGQLFGRLLSGRYYSVSWKSMSSMSFYVNDDEVANKDTVVTYAYETKPTFEYYSNGQPPLTDEEVQTSAADDDVALMNIHNVYKTFCNKRFAGSKCNLSVYSKFQLPITYECSYTDFDYAPYYYCYQTVVVSSISEDYYYYIKVLNTRSSDTYEDNSELTGPARIPSNITGGVGNIFLVTNTTATVQALNGWHPKRVDSPIYYDEGDYYYYGLR
ncbi:MAG: DUF4249 family protein [Bacteroidales bacterium]|nr:DUF4249 family protein [Bacteroidales bacterium]